MMTLLVKIHKMYTRKKKHKKTKTKSLLMSLTSKWEKFITNNGKITIVKTKNK